MRWKTQEASIPLTVNVTWADGFVNMTSLGQFHDITFKCLMYPQVVQSSIFDIVY